MMGQLFVLMITSFQSQTYLTFSLYLQQPFSLSLLLSKIFSNIRSSLLPLIYLRIVCVMYQLPNNRLNKKLCYLSATCYAQVKVQGLANYFGLYLLFKSSVRQRLLVCWGVDVRCEVGKRSSSPTNKSIKRCIIYDLS